MAYGSPERLEDVPAYYADIRGGRPVTLERELGLPVFTGMKHWRPRIADAAEAALVTGAGVVVGLVLAPHYSRLSIAGYREQLERALDARAELRMIESWHDFEPFVDALAARVRGTTAHVVFTAHSLPARTLDDGDPYQASCSRRRGSSRRPRTCASGRSRTRASRRRASRGSAPTSSTTSASCTLAACATCSSARSASSPTTSRFAGTSTSRRRIARAS